jgi:SAM-dependent methyltransferase
MAQYYPSDYAPYVQTASPGRLRSLLRDAPAARAPGRRFPRHDARDRDGVGNFLIDMQRRGWQVTGLEWDGISAERAARRTGATVLAGDVAEMQFQNDGFDLICGWMVFEHLDNPREALARCFDWLRPGGWRSACRPEAGRLV